MEGTERVLLVTASMAETSCKLRPLHVPDMTCPNAGVGKLRAASGPPTRFYPSKGTGVTCYTLPSIFNF